ncbi:MAG TPA: PilT/PilU family type 4a pilus ATPase [Thermoanaerobaculia bacterium]|nr:PilT/PilU family type 4a pilus ATPase [Thermoanaerobaculia bacterium]
MNDYLKNPELERLVEELNREQDRSNSDSDSSDEGSESERRRAERPLQTEPGLGSPLEKVLREMARLGASDLLLISGAPPVLRLSGHLTPLDQGPLDSEDVQTMFAPFLNRKTTERLEKEGSTDFSLRLGPGSTQGDADLSGAWRFRINLHRQRGNLAAAVRALPMQIPTLAELNLPPVFSELVRPSRGLVLICGPTGSGKSSTLAALVGELNRKRPIHIVTIEDPIEYEHRNARAIIEQVEVGRDSPSFSAALRASLRQDPDVILVGEMRDLDTVATALTAAETGHLILSTLHTSDASQAIHRMVDVFPPAQQGQIRHQLALSLHAIACQQLVPRPEGRGRVPAVELMLANTAIRNHIRNERLQNLKQEITLGKRQGMITFEESLAQLVHLGAISEEEARIRAWSEEEFGSQMRGSK